MRGGRGWERERMGFVSNKEDKSDKNDKIVENNYEKGTLFWTRGPIVSRRGARRTRRGGEGRARFRRSKRDDSRVDEIGSDIFDDGEG